MVSVEELKEVEWNLTVMDQLVLETEKKAMLQGSVSRHYLPNSVKHGETSLGQRRWTRDPALQPTRSTEISPIYLSEPDVL